MVCRTAAMAGAVLALGAGAFAAPVRAQTFEELEARLAEHPSVAALLSEADARKDLAKAERALPDPVLSFGVAMLPVRNPGFTTESDSNKAFGVMQEIPNFGVRRARAARGRGESEAAELEAQYRLARLHAALIENLAEKRAVKERLTIADALMKRYADFDDVLRGEVEAGRPTYYRLGQIDVERAEVDRSIVELKSRLAAIDAALVALVGDAPDTPPPDVQIAVWDGEAGDLYATRIAEAGVEVAEAGVREGKAAFGPNFGVNFTYMQRESGVDPAGQPFSGDDWFAAGATVSIPLWAPSSQTRRLRAARARKSGAEAEYQAAYRDARERLLSLRAEQGAAVRSIALFEREAEALQRTIAAARRNYEAGEGDYATVLDAEIARLTLLERIAEEKARATASAARFNSELVTP